MSQNVETIRRSHAAFRRRDFEALNGLSDPDFEWQTMEQVVGRGCMRGWKQVAEWIADVLETFDEVEFEIEDLIEGADDVVLAVLWKGRASQSGAPVEIRFGQHIMFRDGRLLRIRDYATAREALEAAGLTDG